MVLFSGSCSGQRSVDAKPAEVVVPPGVVAATVEMQQFMEAVALIGGALTRREVSALLGEPSEKVSPDCWWYYFIEDDRLGGSTTTATAEFLDGRLRTLDVSSGHETRMPREEWRPASSLKCNTMLGRSVSEARPNSHPSQSCR